MADAGTVSWVSDQLTSWWACPTAIRPVDLAKKAQIVRGLRQEAPLLPSVEGGGAEWGGGAGGRGCRGNIWYSSLYYVKHCHTVPNTNLQYSN